MVGESVDIQLNIGIKLCVLLALSWAKKCSVTITENKIMIIIKITKHFVVALLYTICMGCIKIFVYSCNLTISVSFLLESGNKFVRKNMKNVNLSSVPIYGSTWNC